MRRLLVLVICLLVVFVGVLIVGELVVEPAVERRIGREVQTRYGLATRPEVRIDAFPFLVDAVRGELDGAEVEAADVVVEDLRVDHALLDARRLEFDLGDLMRGDGEVRADRVDARVEVTDEALNEYLLDRRLAYTVTFTAGEISVAGTTTIAGRQVSGTASGTVAIVGTTLRFTPTGVEVIGAPLDASARAQLQQSLAFEVPIPVVVGVQITGVDVGEGRAVLVAEVNDHVLAA